MLRGEDIQAPVSVLYSEDLQKLSVFFLLFFWVYLGLVISLPSVVPLELQDYFRSEFDRAKANQTKV